MEWESDSPCCSHTYPGQGVKSPGRHSSWELEFRNCGAIPGWGMLMTAERRMEGMWGRRLWWEMHGGNPGSHGTWQCCWVMHSGWSHQHSLSLPTLSIGSWTRERLAHQMPETLIQGVGSQPEWLICMPDAWENREGPQAREPSKCLNRWSYGERQAKEAFWTPATRGSKKKKKKKAPIGP